MTQYTPPSLFGKPLDDVTVDDVKQFCEKQIKEGVNLDYKKDLSSSKSIVKAIASMGNTRGGWLIVGVDDEDDKPVLPAKGMEYKAHLELSITNMILSYMSPPLFPIVKVCTPDEHNKTFIIIYVPESDQAPHWLFNKKELYIRVEQRTDSTDWERFATSDEWEWLRNKREKSIELRKDFKEEINSYFLKHLDKDSMEKTIRERNDSFLPSPILPSKYVLNRDGTEKMLNLTISPTFPTETLMSVNETFDKLREIAVPDLYGTSDRFPTFLEDSVVFQKGTIAFNQFADDRNYFTALNLAGMLSFKETVVYEKMPPGEDRVLEVSYVDFDRIVIRLEAFLHIAANLFNSLNYQGLVSLDVHLDGEDWMRMNFPTQTFNPRLSQNANGQFYWEKTFLANELKVEKSREEILKETINNLMFSFGWKDFNWNIFDNTMERFRR